MAAKYEPFVKQHLGAKYNETAFDKLSISTATMDVRMHEDTNINFKRLFDDLPVVSIERPTETKMPAGTIFAMRWQDQVRGTPPTTTETALKNTTTIWMWLEEKHVNVKISCNNYHITGCKKISQAAETARLLQLHMQILESQTTEIPAEGNDSLYYSCFPFALRFDVCMVNYNFNLGVAIDLPAFDLFIAEKYSEWLFSPYDQNIHKKSMPLKCPALSMKFMINDNGQISMCTSESVVENSHRNVSIGYGFFREVVTAFRATIV